MYATFIVLPHLYYSKMPLKARQKSGLTVNQATNTRLYYHYIYIIVGKESCIIYTLRILKRNRHKTPFCYIIFPKIVNTGVSNWFQYIVNAGELAPNRSEACNAYCYLYCAVQIMYGACKNLDLPYYVVYHHLFIGDSATYVYTNTVQDLNNGLR